MQIHWINRHRRLPISGTSCGSSSSWFPPALFFTGRLLWSLPPAQCLGCCSFPCSCWLWPSLTAGLEFLCLLLFWGPVQWSVCWLPIKVNRHLETLFFFCWLRSRWATGVVKCRCILLLALENSFSYFFSREFCSQKLSFLCQTLSRRLLTQVQITSPPFGFHQ